MAVPDIPSTNPITSTPKRNIGEYPWWLFIILLFILYMGWRILTGEEYGQAFEFMRAGFGTTLYVTFMGFALSVVLGLLAGMGRISRNPIARQIAITYIEFIRGVPILVLIFTVAFVIVPDVSSFLNLSNSTVPQIWRGIIALATIYGAFLAEVFRAGIESIPKGQMEAARSLGMSHRQAMQHIILPQAIRNILPALGNNFIAMLKDSSLISVLAVADITYQAKLYSNASFRFRETYLILTFMYLTMTLVLSLLQQWYERRLDRED
ncbi:MAG TPA: amino acid ABC transporter permease [Anaerolineae bacterium]|nr:amino acid ABC transporter permease [Anaerolineae bacterium]